MARHHVRHHDARRAAVLALALTPLAAGCVLAPAGRRQEQARAVEAGKAWAQPAADRVVPDLPPAPEWRDVLARAFLANGALEAAYYEWRAALARVDVAAGWPNTNVTLGFEYMFSGGNLKAWDRSTLSVGFDPMQNLSFPTKVMAAGRVAFADAQAAGRRFAMAKFDLQRRVLVAWWEYALGAEKIRLQERSAALRRLGAATAAGRVATGARQVDVLRTGVDAALAENGLHVLETAQRERRARLNALLARPAEAPLDAPASLPAARDLPADDARILVVASDANPELAALAFELQGREDAVDLARQQFIPDWNPFASFTGSMEQAAGILVSLPARVPIVLGQIREARALLARADALARQTRFERGADVVATLAGLRDLERQLHLLEARVLPASRRATDDARAAYERGVLSLPELLDAEQTQVELRLLVAEARTARETRLAELEALAGVDLETVLAPDVAVRALSPRTPS